MTFRVRDLTYRYPNKKKPALDLDGVALEIPTGATTAVLGMSGSGKTTLLNILGLLAEGSIRPGNVVLEDGDRRYDYGTLTRTECAHLRLTNFGFVLQSSYLLPNFSCACNVQMPLLLQGVSRRERRRMFDELLVEVDPRRDGLAAAKDNRPGQVSGGERQRMAVLRAIIHDPKLIFADEPFGSLDPINRRRVVQLLTDWQAGTLRADDHKHERTLLLVTHEIDIAYDIADCFVLLAHGRVLGETVLCKDRLSGGLNELKKLIDPESEA